MLLLQVPRVWFVNSFVNSLISLRRMLNYLSNSLGSAPWLEPNVTNTCRYCVIWCLGVYTWVQWTHREVYLLSRNVLSLARKWYNWLNVLLFESTDTNSKDALINPLFFGVKKGIWIKHPFKSIDGSITNRSRLKLLLQNTYLYMCDIYLTINPTHSISLDMLIHLYR